MISIGCVRVDEPARLVRDLGDDAVDRRDQHVDGEHGADARVGGGEPGERMSAEAEERSRPERDQDEVAGIAGDAREDAEKTMMNVSTRRRDADELSDQRPISPAFSATPTPIIATKITATTLKFGSSGRTT